MTKIFKSIFSIILITILIIQYFIFIGNSNKTVSVFSEINSSVDDYSNYLVDFYDTLNTENFNEKFSILNNNDYEIKKLYLNINDTWGNDLKNKLSEYSYDSLENFIINYKNNLTKYNLAEEIPNVDVSGIKINKVLIYTSEKNIEKLKKTNSEIEYIKK